MSKRPTTSRIKLERAKLLGFGAPAAIVGAMVGNKGSSQRGPLPPAALPDFTLS